MKYLLLFVLIACARVEVKKPSPVIVPDVISTPNESIEITTVPEQVDIRQTFAVKSDLKWIKDLAPIGECVIRNEAFLKEVGEHKQFDMTKLTSKEVEKKLREYTPVVLSSYCKKPRFGVQTNAYRNIGSNIVYFNTCILNRSVIKNINTLAHEWSHIQGFGHGNNSYKGKSMTVPYRLGELAEKYVKECL